MVRLTNNKSIFFSSLVLLLIAIAVGASIVSLSRWQQSRLNWQRDFTRWQTVATSTDDIVKTEALIKTKISAAELIVSYFQVWSDELLPLSGERGVSTLTKTATSEIEWWQDKLRQLTLLDLTTVDQGDELQQQLADKWPTTRAKAWQVSSGVVLLRFKIMYEQLKGLGDELKRVESSLTYPVGWQPFSATDSQWRQILEQIRLSLQLADEQWQAAIASNRLDDAQRLFYTLQQLQQSMISAQKLLSSLQQSQ